MSIGKKLIDLYNLGEQEDIKFFNIKLARAKGTTSRKSGVTLICISIKLNEREEYFVLVHEMGHYYMDCTTKFSVPVSKMIDEARANRWKAIYLISRKKYIEAMHSPFVYSDYDMAEELDVDIESVECIHDYFRSQGLSVSQAELGCVYREP